MASSTKNIPSTRPVKTCAASAEREMSITTSSRDTLLGARAVQLLVGGDVGHHGCQSRLALQLVLALEDPEVRERLVVAPPPPLLALVVVVGGVLPERVGHLLGVG